MQETESTATGRAVILEIVRAMRENLEPLVFSTVAPARFFVYLHPADHKRLEGIFPLVVEQARRALDDEVRRSNEQSAADKLRKWLMKDAPLPAIDAPRDGWEIRFEPDLDGEMQPGDIAVASELVLPAPTELAGSRTRRVTTMQSARGASRREQTLAGVAAEAGAPGAGGPAPDGTVYATLSYEDQQGFHRFVVSKDEVVVGRGGVGYWVDVKLHTSADVSREHIRLRRDPVSGQFFLKDLSSLGTTIDGRPVDSSIEVVDGNKRDKGVEVALPDRARIGLAGTIFLQFEAGAKS